MSGFSADWLALREGADARARAAPRASVLLDGLVDALLTGRAPGRPLRVVDMGSGSGANLRCLAPRLGRDQHWLLVDDDAALLEHAPGTVRAWARAGGCAVSTKNGGLRIEAPAFSAALRWRRIDLAARFDSLALHDVDLLTASALLDLVSHAWIDRLVERCRAARCAVLFALSYDGRVAWRPALDADEEIRLLLNRHQGRDKGFGPAAGPQAAAYAAERLRAAGFDVRQGRSDWRLAGGDRALQEALARGWAQAAVEAEPSRRSAIDSWLARRLEHVARQNSMLTVGHVDLFGLPPAA